MSPIVSESAQPRLERSCGASSADWIRRAPPRPGLERIEAFFAGHAFDPHRHDTYAIGYTLAGVQSFTYRRAPAVSRPGNVIVLHPDERHDGHAGTETGFRYRMLYIEPRLIRDALGENARSLPFLRDAVSMDARLMAALGLALGDLDRELEPLESDHAVLAIADALLARDGSAKARPLSSSCASAVERARHFLDEHFGRAVASEELETIAGVDRYRLARHFRARLGTSPYRYLTMRRLDHVRAAIGGGYSLAEAAAAAGFADQSHMTRHFKRAYGLAPGRWRAIHIAG